jgi:hypothetical protein
MHPSPVHFLLRQPVCQDPYKMMAASIIIDILSYYLMILWEFRVNRHDFLFSDLSIHAYLR